MLNINLSTARRIHPFSGTENSFALEYDETAFNPINPEDVNNYFSWEQSSKSYDYASSPSFMSLLFMDQDENVLSFWPYRQLYVGLDGYLGKLSYNLGFDVFDGVAGLHVERDGLAGEGFDEDLHVVFHAHPKLFIRRFNHRVTNVALLSGCKHVGITRVMQSFRRAHKRSSL